MSKKSEGISFVTPFGILRYPKITNPDTKGEYADGKFKTDIVFSAEDYAKVEKLINDAAKQLLPEGVKDPQLPLYSWKDKEGNDEGSGTRAKSKYRAVVFDVKNTKLADALGIGGGTEARLAVTAKYYKKGKNEGINLYLNKVQIRKLVEYTSADECPFDETEGFVADGAEASPAGDESFDSL